jgi:hypothetical protein
LYLSLDEWIKEMTTQTEADNLATEAKDADSVVGSVLVRLASVLQQENGLLETSVETDHTSYIVAKNQALRELMVLQRAHQFSSLSPEIIQSLRDVRKLVDRNSQLLKLQVSALNDLTSFLTQSVISEQGDGTYTREHQ